MAIDGGYDLSILRCSLRNVVLVCEGTRAAEWYTKVNSQQRSRSLEPQLHLATHVGTEVTSQYPCFRQDFDFAQLHAFHVSVVPLLLPSAHHPALSLLPVFACM